jgi:AcrR family transcriptional regulator
MPPPIDENTILDATLKVVTERGYSGATTKLIAETAGVGEVTLFRRFGNKETLILEAMRRDAAKLDREVSLYTGQLEVDLIRVVRAYQIILQTRAALMLTYANEVTRHPELKDVFKFVEITANKIMSMLQRYQDEGELKQTEPIHQLAALFGPLMMTTIFDLVGFQAKPLNIEEHVMRFLDGQAP